MTWVANSLDSLAIGLRSPSLAAHQQAPAIPFRAAAAPAPWTIPSCGSEWCDCGEHHDLDRETVSSFAEDLVNDPSGWHPRNSSTRPWTYIEMCEFFLMGIRVSAGSVNGTSVPKYHFECGLDIVAHFSRNRRVPG